MVYIGRKTCGIFYHHNGGLKQLHGRRASANPCRTINASMHSGECFEKNPLAFRGLGRHSQLSIWTDLFLLEHCFRVFPLLINWVPLHQDGVVLLIFFCVLCVWGRHSSTCSYPLLQRRRGFLHHIAWLLPKATPAGINLSLASKTTFVQTCCSKKEVSHLQSLPRNFCVDSTLSDFDFWISLFVLPQQHGQLLAPGETFSRTEERVWHILCLSRFSAQGKSGILRWKKHFVSWKEYPKSWCLYISDSCCMLGNTCWLFDLNTLLFILLACLSGFVVWFGLVFSLGLFSLFGFVAGIDSSSCWCSVCELDTRELSQEARMKTGTPSFETDWRSWNWKNCFMAGQPLVSLCKAS